LRACR